MRDILVFRTASDDVMNRLFDEIEQKRCVCLIQDNEINRYKELYPDIKFVNIKKNFFDEDYIISTIGKKLKKVFWNEIYVCGSYSRFKGYDNIICIIEELRYRYRIMYNCFGEKEIYRYSKIKDLANVLYAFFALFFSNIYRTIYVIFIKNKI